MKKLLNIGLSNQFAFFSSVFRVFICLHLLKNLIAQWNYIPLLYGNKSFFDGQPTYLLEYIGIDSSLIRENISIFIGVYVFSILLFLVGIGKNIPVLVLFICYETLQRLNPLILNGGDNLLRFCIFYMIFINSFEFFTFKKYKKQSIDNAFSLKNFISNIAGVSICIHLCLVYFISAIHKIHSDVWFNGVATYYTLSIERFKGTAFNSQLAKNGTFVTLTTYFTLLVEITYPTLIWFKQTKFFLIFSAILMHIGIYVLMMIYDFQIVFIMVQGFFIPNRVWINIYNKMKEKTIRRIPPKYKPGFKVP
jgi:hypothetical protein